MKIFEFRGLNSQKKSQQKDKNSQNERNKK